MKILITGAGGQLGTDLVKVLSGHHEVFPLVREKMDVTDMKQVLEVVETVLPDTIIHAAAYTRVDQAESDIDTAYLVNAYGTRNLAVAAQRTKAKMLYISTDYVFDGNHATPYQEFDETHPHTIYGKSKLAGEKMTMMLANKVYIVRTSWLYGEQGENFVKTMLKLAKQKERINVVNDQFGSPTYTMDLVSFIERLIHTEKYGIYHASNSGFCSWYEFAKAIFEELKIQVNLQPVSSQEFPRPALRPYYSVLNNMSIRLNGFPDFRHWREALRSFLNEIKLR